MTPASRREDNRAAGEVVFRRVGSASAPYREYPFPFLPDEPHDGSISVGTVTNGILVQGAELCLPADDLGVCQRQLLRNLRFTTDEMLVLLHHTARSVAQAYPGSTLRLGNLSRRGGGDIPYSVSHNSGRDADVAYYFVNEAGTPLAAHDLITVGPDLLAYSQGKTYHFDPARNWAMVRALLTHPEIQLQFIFMANHLKRTLLEYARQQGEPRELIERAQIALVQPSRHSPHDDHAHIRIYCSREDIGGGCQNIGRIHPWIDTFPDAFGQRLAQVREYLDETDPDIRLAAIRRLVLLDSREDLPQLAEFIEDPNPRLRVEAVRALTRLGGDAFVDEILENLTEETEPRVVAASVEALGHLGGDRARDFLLSTLSHPQMIVLGGCELDWRALAVDALTRLEAHEAVSSLVELLASEDAFLRARVIWSLSRLTNRRFGRDWEDLGQDRATRWRGERQWAEWAQTQGDESRESWLIGGFQQAGYAVLDAQGPNLESLVKAIDAAQPYLRYNAQTVLMQVTDTQVPSLRWSRHDAGWYWQREVLRTR